MLFLNNTEIYPGKTFYNCGDSRSVTRRTNLNCSADKTVEELTIEGQESEYDSMEKEIMAEEEWIEKQANSLNEGSEAEEDIREENLDDNFETPSM